jgi:hypothetical protein
MASARNVSGRRTRGPANIATINPSRVLMDQILLRIAKTNSTPNSTACGDCSSADFTNQKPNSRGIAIKESLGEKWHYRESAHGGSVRIIPDRPPYRLGRALIGASGSHRRESFAGRPTPNIPMGKMIGRSSEF